MDQYRYIHSKNLKNDSNLATIVCPYDQAIIGHVEYADAAYIDQALTRAHALFCDRKQWLPVYRRIAILHALAQLMTENAQALAMLIASEGGKPLQDATVEVARAIDGVGLCAEHIRNHQGSVVPMATTEASRNRIAFSQKEPIGVVVAVSAFNHPLNLIVHQAVAAIAAGCPVIVKPAAATALSAFYLTELIYKAGLEPAWCQTLLPQNNELATQLVCDQRVGFFSFIGSAAVGWMLRSKLAAGTRCALEHGGVAPVIVAEDADIETTTNALCKGGFYHAGQVCVSVQRIFAHRSIAETLAQSLTKKAKALRVGDPRDIKTDVGPLINTKERDRVKQWLDEAASSGGRILCGGDVLENNCHQCTVVYDPDDNARISKEEIFGPAVSIYPYQNIEEALSRANQLKVAFQAAVFTKSLDIAMHCYRMLNASAVMLNDHTAFRVDHMPFAGLAQSGLGIGGCGHTIDDMQIEKMLVHNTA